MARKVIREPEEPIETHTTDETRAGATTVASSDLGEYEIDGRTFLLSAEEAKARGAKAVRPSNKAVTPENK
jgi:hypothetical protein